MTPDQTVSLPQPISTNNLFVNVRGKGRVRSQRYNTWRNAALWMLKAKKPKRITGPVEVDVFIPDAYRGDIDNGLKCLLDALVEAGCIEDDKHIKSLSVKRYGGKDSLLIYRAYGQARAA